MLKALINTNLMHLHIVQNQNTPGTVMPCSAKAWTNFKCMINENPKIHLTAINCDLLIQPEAPVYSITCKMVRPNLIFENLLFSINFFSRRVKQLLWKK